MYESHVRKYSSYRLFIVPNDIRLYKIRRVLKIKSMQLSITNFLHILQFYTLWLTEIQYNFKRLLWGPVAMVTEAIKNTIGFQAILKANCQ